MKKIGVIDNVIFVSCSTNYSVLVLPHRADPNELVKYKLKRSNRAELAKLYAKFTDNDTAVVPDGRD